jgi:hypothetical protein
MATAITADFNEQTGNVDLSLAGFTISLPPNAAIVLAARFLRVLGKTSLTLDNDAGTYTVR